MEDIYIATIRYAVKRNGKFLLSELRENLGLSDEQFQILTVEIYTGKILVHGGGSYPDFSRIPEQISIWPSSQDRFRLIEYDELQEARAAAIGANKHAVLAIAISALLAMASIGLTVWQMHESDKDTAAILERLDKINSTMEMIEARTALGLAPPAAKSYQASTDSR